MKEQFRARFYVKYGEALNDRVQEYKDSIVNFKELKETKLKPPDVFIRFGGSYLFDEKAAWTYDNEGRPILRYILHNMIAVDTPTMNVVEVKSVDGSKTAQYTMPINGVDEIVQTPKIFGKELSSIGVTNKTQLQKIFGNNFVIGIIGKIMDARNYNAMQVRGEMKSVIASTTKETPPFDKMQAILLIGAGGAIGAVAVLMAVLADPHFIFPYGVSAKGIIREGLRLIGI